MSQPPTVAHRIRPPPRLGDRTRKLGPLLELQDARPKRAIPDRGAVRRPSIGANMEQQNQGARPGAATVKR